MRTILITGGIGSGKTVVCGMLREYGFPVYDCDSAAKRLYDEDPALVEALEKATGASLRLPDGTFDKSSLAKVIFSDPDAMSKVESIVHPAVLRDFTAWRSRNAGGRGVVMESAIAMEKPLFDRQYDSVILVDAPIPVRIARACSRDGSEPAKIEARIRTQNYDISRIDAVILNDSSLPVLRSRTLYILNNMLNLK